MVLHRNIGLTVLYYLAIFGKRITQFLHILYTFLRQIIIAKLKLNALYPPQQVSEVEKLRKPSDRFRKKSLCFGQVSHSVKFNECIF